MISSHDLTENNLTPSTYGSVEGSKWTCSACTYDNTQDQLVCEMCDAKKLQNVVVAASSDTTESNCHLCWEQTAPPNVITEDFNASEVKLEGVLPSAVLLGCEHACCFDCIAGWVQTRLGEGKTHIPCPVCPPPPPPSDSSPQLLRPELPFAVISVCAGEEAVQKLRRFQQERLLESDANSFWCSNPKCGKGFVNKDTARRVVCVHCRASSCRKCKKPFHVLPRCSAHDPLLAAWEADAIARGRELKACPGCKRKTEREGGCLNITCTCGQRYCWVCLMAWPCPNGCGLKSGADGTRNAQAAPVNLVGARQMYARRMGCCGLAVIGTSIVGALIIGLYMCALALCLLFCPCLVLCKLELLCRPQFKRDFEWLNRCSTIVYTVLIVVVCIPVFAAAALVIAVPGVIYLFYVIVVGACVDSGISHSLYGPMLQLQGNQPWLDRTASIYARYKGPLPAKLVVAGKVGLVVLWLCISLPIGLVVCVVWAPIAPCFLLPVCIYPRLTTSKWAKFFVTVASVAAGLLLYFYLPLEMQPSARLVIAIGAFVIGLGIAFKTPTSDWAFLGPLWQGALPPCAAILGYKNPVNPENNPFTGPVPFPGPYILAFEDWNGHIAL